MLAELNIRNLVLFDRQRLAFEPGLTAISGSTGSGKSLVLSALRFALGARASQELIRPGADEAAVEALFYVDVPEERAGLAALLPDAPGLEEGELVLSRTLSRRGRSRATVNGRLVPIATLREVGGVLVEFSGQHDALALARPETQRQLLDAFGGLEGPRRAYREAYDAHRAAASRLEALADERGEVEREAAALRETLEMLEPLAPEHDEATAVQRELGVVENARRIQDALQGCFLELSEKDHAVLDRLGAHARALRGVGDLLPAALPLAEQLDEQEACLREVAYACRHLSDGIEHDEARLAELSDRLSALERAARRLRVPADRLASHEEAAAARLRALEGLGDELASLRTETDRAERALVVAGEALSAGRRAAATELDRQVALELDALGLQGAELRCEVREEAPGLDGLDGIELLFRANEGGEARPLRRAASGGEAARVMLALRTLLAGRGSVPTLVFDEIDTGVGGRLGAVIGERLSSLATRYQVVCVTHLAQVASYASHHLAVTKAVEGGKTYTAVRSVEGQPRVQELAQMLRGDRMTDSTLREARQMVESARRGDA